MLGFLALFSLPAAAADFHTTPDKWREPRQFHAVFEQRFSDRIQMERTLEPPPQIEKVYSNNRAYFFMVTHPDTRKPGPWELVVSIFNERPGFLHVQMKDVSQYDHVVRWINEKLIFIRVWWGRVVATDMIIDAEKESVVYREMVYDGTNAFEQWKQSGQ